MLGGTGLAVATYQEEEFDFGWGQGGLLYVCCTEEMNAGSALSVGGGGCLRRDRHIPIARGDYVIRSSGKASFTGTTTQLFLKGR